MVKNLKKGDIVFVGVGNGVYGTFAKVEMRKVIKSKPYQAIIVKNYGSIWADGVPKPRDIIAVTDDNVFETFDEAKEKFKEQMEFKDDGRIIKLIFTRMIK